MSFATFHRPRLAAHVLGLAFCAGVALLLVLSGGAHAAGTTPVGTTATTPKGESTPLSNIISDPGSSTTTSSGGSSGIVRMIVGLAIVIGVIYGITWILRQTKKTITGSDEDFGAGLDTTAMLTLGPGRTLQLVKAGNEYLLLGVSDGGVQQLRSYTEQEARDAGFPIDDDAVDELRPMGKDRISQSTGTAIVERLRDMTVRR